MRCAAQGSSSPSPPSGSATRRAAGSVGTTCRTSSSRPRAVRSRCSSCATSTCPRAEPEAMTADDFWEIGASGRRYSREYVLETVAARLDEPVEDSWRTDDFHCRELAPGVYLLTYTLLQGERRTRRASIWQRSAVG